VCGKADRMSNIAKTVSTEGNVELRFNAKGSRVNEESYMSLILMVLLFPVSCFMRCDKPSSLNDL
jgi:hypothetical protein